MAINDTQTARGDFDLASLRGGLDDTSPHISMAPDSCVVAENVEFVVSTLGERRKGCVAIDLPVEITDNSALQAVTWMYRHLPTNNEGEAEFWVLAQSLSTNDSVLARNTVNGWEVITPNDPITVTDGLGHRISAQTLHGKLFLAYKSGVDRLHVFDGSSLRRVGLAEPTSPTVISDGSGTFDTTRFYRIRYVIMDGTAVVSRSEPSEAFEFTPPGTGSGAEITKPVTIGEDETHWEVEASLDDANYYRIARLAIGTTTYVDETDAAAGYATIGNFLSEDLADYTLIHSGKYLSVDQDRLIIAGSYEDPDQASRVSWTPVYAAPGAGNDERLELGTDPYLDLDGFEGGEITGLSRAVNGYLFVFKRSHIYKMLRTGERSQAYEAIPITKARGALPGSLVEAVNQVGQPAQYFLDPSIGPCRMSAEGLQWCGRDIQNFWLRVNKNAEIPCHGVYYPAKRQLHYWVAIDGAEHPNAKIVLHVNEMRNTEEGGRRGWVTVAKNDRIATAHCSTMFASNIDDNEDRSFTLVPFIGKERWTVGAVTVKDFIQRCDVGGTDAHVSGDEDSTYRATVKSKPFALSGLLNQHGVLAGALLARSSDEPDGLVYVKLIGDFGLEEKLVAVSLLADHEEDHVVRQLDNLRFAEVYTLQIELGDLDENVTPPDTWEFHRLQLKISGGAKA